MRKLVLAFAGLLLSSNAFAFTDSATINATKSLIAHVQTQGTLQERNATLERYKEFLSNRLNTFEMPEDALNVDDELAMEFASLNEFESYVMNIDLRKLNQKSCAAAKARVEAATGASQDQLSKGQIGSEALLAQEIINALCK
ncbi:hypothetical protein [Bdellovibrio svalbardensis]|uniref:Uncharacterized protein n=1 Tax=Bdellovibrio svalbardensis TaxID=2972972 RepID=A0ABT6DHC9_9BACT|nr:hypothetical protein [Bdellovibrio svalbardensis]MDG0815660.1 hypothetical protein [Bdellovibrio svalbardensis]